MPLPFLTFVVAGFLLAALSPLLTRLLKQHVGWVLALFPLGIFGYLLTYLPTILNKHPVVIRMAWVPSLGIDFSVYLDGLSIMMALLVTGMGALVFIYAGGYLKGDHNLGRFYIFLLIFMTAMLGVVFAGNIILLFCFWELTSISSYLLIGYKHTYEDSREAAKQALIVTGGGGLALLAGLVLLGHMGNTYDLYTLLQRPPTLFTSHPLYIPALLCLAAGAFTKSAQVPFHFWLPGAMAAPTPVSAYLHSATMVKAGIYLMARFSPIMSDSDLWFYLVGGFGAATMLTGAFLSWQNSDLKKILAYSTISVLGTLMLIIGMMGKTPYAKEAFFTFLLAHAFYKGCLFMIAGSVDHETGTREIGKLNGLMRVMPITFIAAAIAAVSKAGLPFLFGFVGKELLYEATLHASPLIMILTALAVISNAMVGASAGLVIIRPFLGRQLVVPPNAHVHEAPISMWIGPVILSIATLVFGFFPGLLDKLGDSIIVALSPAGYHADSHVHLAIFHGFSLIDHGAPTPLLLSMLTVAGAISIYRLRDKLVPIVRPLRGDEWGAQRWYQLWLQGMVNSAARITNFLQNGQLPWYIGIITAYGLFIIGGTLLFKSTMNIELDFTGVRLHEVMLVIIVIVAAIAAACFHNVLAAVAALGVVGFSMAVFFILFQAPDLAMTQFAIETLSVVLIALIIGRLPRKAEQSRNASIPIAIMAGVLMTTIVMITLTIPIESQLTETFAHDSYIKAHGRNIVNVILVDFRGIDTLGEITVLSIAGIGVYALSKLQIQSDQKNQYDEGDV